MGSLKIIDDVTVDRRSRMNSEVYRAIPSHFSQMLQKLLDNPSHGTWIMTVNIQLKLLKTFEGKKRNILK